MQVPIACTLRAHDREARVEEWRAFRRTYVKELVRHSPTRLCLRLGDDAADVAQRAVDLARREHACCSFFGFSLRVSSDATWLEVDVPTDASGVLDTFAQDA